MTRRSRHASGRPAARRTPDVRREEGADFLIKRNLRKERPGGWLERARHEGTAEVVRAGKTIYRGACDPPRVGHDPVRVVYQVTERTITARSSRSWWALYNAWRAAWNVRYGGQPSWTAVRKLGHAAGNGSAATGLAAGGYRRDARTPTFDVAVGCGEANAAKWAVQNWGGTLTNNDYPTGANDFAQVAA